MINISLLQSPHGTLGRSLASGHAMTWQPLSWTSIYSINSTPRLINPLLWKKQLHCLLSPVETVSPSLSYPAYCVGKRSLRLLSICTHILGVLPSRQIALGTARHSEHWCLTVLYLLPCSFAPVCHQRPEDWGSQANRHSTQWTRRIIFVEGRDRDRLSHNSPHHQYFTPSRELNKTLWLIQIIISRIQWLAH